MKERKGKAGEAACSSPQGKLVSHTEGLVAEAERIAKRPRTLKRVNQSATLAAPLIGVQPIGAAVIRVRRSACDPGSAEPPKTTRQSLQLIKALQLTIDSSTSNAQAKADFMSLSITCEIGLSDISTFFSANPDPRLRAQDMPPNEVPETGSCDLCLDETRVLTDPVISLGECKHPKISTPRHLSLSQPTVPND